MSKQVEQNIKDRMRFHLKQLLDHKTTIDQTIDCFFEMIFEYSGINFLKGEKQQ